MKKKNKEEEEKYFSGNKDEAEGKKIVSETCFNFHSSIIIIPSSYATIVL